MKSLLIGTGLAKISSESLAILNSKTLLAFNQDDVHGKPTIPFKWGTNPNWAINKYHPADFLSGQLKEGIMILLLNNHDDTRSRSFNWKDLSQVKGSHTYRINDGGKKP